MVSEKVIVKNKSGLHMRPAKELVSLCSKIKSTVTIAFGERKINPKSILMLMSGGIKCGSEIEVFCEGDNENEDLIQIIAAIKDGFGEEIVDEI